MRTLATIQKIVNIKPISGADKIEVATILGWEVVVKKGDFNINDLCVYIEIDSILPPYREFEFLEPRRYRVKTIKLKKQISQGIAFPIQLLKKYLKDIKIKEGIDITELLNVTKHDPEFQKEKKLKTYTHKNPIIKFMFKYKWFRKLFKTSNEFPSFIPKTDEIRIQKIPSKLRDNNDLYYKSEKLDGQSGTFLIINKPILGFKRLKTFVCSRNLTLNKPNKSNYWKIYNQLHLKEKLKELYNIVGNVAIQGEIIGEGIQKNKYEVKGLDFYVFSIYDINEKKYVNYKNLIELTSSVNLNTVPIINTNIILPDNINDIVEDSKNLSIINTKSKNEGYVYRNIIDSHDSFKCINPEFLLKYDL